MKFLKTFMVGAGASALVGFSTLSAAQMAPAPAQDDQSDSAPSLGRWLGRVRGIDFVPGNHSAPFSYLGGNFGPHAVTIGQKFGFEADITYFLKPWLGVELGISGLQQDFSLAGAGQLGTITQYPMTLMVQYHYQVPHMPIKPYVGLGFDFVQISAVDVNAVGNQLGMTRRVVGTGYDVGVDVAVSYGFYVNFDFKHIQDASNLKDPNGNILTDVNMVPNIFSIGIGYRF